MITFPRNTTFAVGATTRRVQMGGFTKDEAKSMGPHSSLQATLADHDIAYAYGLPTVISDPPEERKPAIGIAFGDPFWIEGLHGIWTFVSAPNGNAELELVSGIDNHRIRGAAYRASLKLRSL